MLSRRAGRPRLTANQGFDTLHAYDLWHANGVVGIWELPRKLDRANFERVLDALELYRGDLLARKLRLLADAA